MFLAVRVGYSLHAALRAANAYCSHAKKALLCGYFPGPTGVVFTCWSHDIIAHAATSHLTKTVRSIEEETHDGKNHH
jgi:hypothetical protein